MSCWVAHSVCCRFATQGPGMHYLGFWHIGDSNIHSNAMEMHLQECWLPADNGACVAAMMLKSQKNAPQVFPGFPIIKSAWHCGKITIKKKTCVLWARFPVRRDVYVPWLCYYVYGCVWHYDCVIMCMWLCLCYYGNVYVTVILFMYVYVNVTFMLMNLWILYLCMFYFVYVCDIMLM